MNWDIQDPFELSTDYNDKGTADNPKNDFDREMAFLLGTDIFDPDDKFPWWFWFTD